MTWVPQSCTLPTEERPLRIAEFGTLFADALIGVERPAPVRVRLLLDATAEPVARELATRETSCCSFFAFAFSHDETGRLLMDVAVPEEHAGVLTRWRTAPPRRSRDQRIGRAAVGEAGGRRRGQPADAALQDLPGCSRSLIAGREVAQRQGEAPAGAEPAWFGTRERLPVSVLIEVHTHDRLPAEHALGHEHVITGEREGPCTGPQPSCTLPSVSLPVRRAPSDRP